MGSESAGISAEMRAACDVKVYLPMLGFVESLNVAMCCSMMLQQLVGIAKDSKKAPGGEDSFPRLDEGAQAQLVAKWRRGGR